MGKHSTRRRRRSIHPALNVQVKNALLMDLSHEVRMPLSAIVGYSEMLLEEAMEGGHHTLLPDLHKLHTASHRVLALLNDIATLANIAAGNTEVCCEVFEVQCLIDEAVTQSHACIHEHDNLLEIDIAGDMHVICSDFMKLKHCLQNILTYACMLTEHGTMTLRVRQEKHQEGAWLVFELRDTGIGFRKAPTDDVLHDVIQTDTTTARQYGGMGLGLAVSRRFCQLLGGELSIQSTVEAGTIYTMRLPALCPPAVTVGQEGEPEHAA